MLRPLSTLKIVRAALGVLIGGSTCLAMAGPIGFSNRSNNIRAGVVITDANANAAGPLNYAPFVWYNLDHDRLVKPAGWNFYNPHATTQITPAIQARWGLPNSLLYTQMNKANAPYWEVQLSSIQDNSINDYDVLLLPIYRGGTLSLNPAERARLQKFVDQGGVLWIDVDNTAVVDAGNGPPLAFGISNAGPAQASVLSPVSQLLTYPFNLSSMPEATYQSSLAPVNLGAAGFGALTQIVAPVLHEFDHYAIEATAGGNGPGTILSSKIGNGYIVVTARGSASFLNQVFPGGSLNFNLGFTAVDAAPDANANQVARFAINAINLTNGSNQDGFGSRKESGTPIDIGAPLIREWADEANGSGPTSGTTPITYKGLLIVPGANRLWVYNAVPGADLDMDGVPDDGIRDLSLGNNYDLVWESKPLNGPISSPVAMEIPNGAGGLLDIIAVVDAGGNLVVFNAFPLTNGSFTVTAGGEPPLSVNAAPNGSPMGLPPGQPPLCPSVHDGLIYVTDNVDNGLSITGRIWAFDPFTGSNVNSWAVGGSSVNAMPQASGGATIGDIPIADNSGGVDCVAYIPSVPGGAAVGAQSAGISSVWIGSKGERHAIEYDNNMAPAQLVINTRASVQGRPVYDNTVAGNDVHSIHVALETANGDVLTIAQMATILSGSNAISNGVVSLGLTANGASLINTLGVTAVSIDYYLDWNSGSPDSARAVRGSVQLPDDGDRNKSILGNLALSPAGTLYAVEANPTDAQAGGMFFALREQGQGAFKVVARFDLYDQFTLSTPGVTTVANTTVTSTFEDNDPTQSFTPFLENLTKPYFTHLIFQGGPAVADGRVFVKARGYKTGKTTGIPIPCTILMCFNAEPNLPSFTVPVLQDGFSILQEDYNRSTDKTQPDAFTTISSNTGQIIYTAGVDHASITLDSLASTQRGQLSQVLNESLPIIIRQPGVPDITIDPNIVGTWSPLQWYTGFYGLDPGAYQSAVPTYGTGSPVVTGNTVFSAANSYLPSIFNGTFNFGTSKPTGMLVAFNAALSATSDAFAKPNTARPYFIQIDQTNGPFAGNFQANSDLLWPMNSSASSFTEYKQRLYQTVLDGANTALSPICNGITAGEGTLFASSDLGVYGFKRANFTVADEGRLASFDPSGNALWTSDQSVSYGLAVASTAGQSNPAVSHPLVRPTRAYPIGTSDYLVVDPGSNRIARIDVSGREVRSLDGFFIDPKFQPDGYVTGEPTTFNQPQDVLSYVDYNTAANNPFTNPQPLEYWRHYVVADGGNRRLVELVDRYLVDPVTRQISNVISLGSLFYHTPATLSGKKGYDYNSVARLQVPNINPAVPPTFVYATSIGTTEPTRQGIGLDTTTQDVIPNGGTAPFQAKDARDGNGGIIVLSNAGTTIVNQVVIPDIAAGVVWNPTTGAFNPNPIPAHYKKLGSLSSVTMAYVNAAAAGNPAQPVLTIMFTDSTGVYEISQAPNPIKGTAPATDWVVDWMLPKEVYSTLRRASYASLPDQNNFLNASELRATFARRTSAGTVLVVNSYFGTDLNTIATLVNPNPPNPFPGEILELNGDFMDPNHLIGYSVTAPYLGFGPLSVTFQLPTVQGARGIIAPIFADRR